MTEYGDFANINPERVLAEARRKFGEIGSIQERLSSLVGEAQSDDGYVKAVYTAAAGLSELELNPRVMRLPSADLAETIKTVVQAAAADFRRKMQSETASLFAADENPMDLLGNPDKVQSKIADAQNVVDGALNDALSQMEKLRKQLGI